MIFIYIKDLNYCPVYYIIYSDKNITNITNQRRMIINDKYLLQNIFEYVKKEKIWISRVCRLWNSYSDKMYNEFESIDSFQRMKFFLNNSMGSDDITHFCEHFITMKVKRRFRLFKYLLKSVHSIFINCSDFYEYLLSYSVLINSRKCSKIILFYKYRYDVRYKNTYFNNENIMLDAVLSFDVSFLRSLYRLYGKNDFLENVDNLCLYSCKVGNLKSLEFFKDIGILKRKENIRVIIECSTSRGYLDILKFINVSFGEDAIKYNNTCLFLAIDHGFLNIFEWLVYEIYKEEINKISVNTIFSTHESEVLYNPRFSFRYWDYILDVIYSYMSE